MGSLSLETGLLLPVTCPRFAIPKMTDCYATVSSIHSGSPVVLVACSEMTYVFNSYASTVSVSANAFNSTSRSTSLSPLFVTYIRSYEFLNERSAFLAETPPAVRFPLPHYVMKDWNFTIYLKG